MIFDGEHVTSLVVKWQVNGDVATMNDIICLSQHLIEAIVSKYDSIYRDDLIQESVLKLEYACKFFNPSVASLHNFFTTVIHNVCNTYVVKQSREYLLDDSIMDNQDGDEYEIELPDHHDRKFDDDDTLDSLIIYLRNRMPSLPVNIIDDCAEVIFYGLSNGDSNRTIQYELLHITGSRSVAQVIYNICIIHLRATHLSCSTVDIDNIPELSLLHELKSLIGEVQFSRLLVAFSGMTIKIPQ